MLPGAILALCLGLLGGKGVGNLPYIEVLWPPTLWHKWYLATMLEVTTPQMVGTIPHSAHACVAKTPALRRHVENGSNEPKSWSNVTSIALAIPILLTDPWRNEAKQGSPVIHTPENMHCMLKVSKLGALTDAYAS